MNNQYAHKSDIQKINHTIIVFVSSKTLDCQWFCHYSTSILENTIFGENFFYGQNYGCFKDWMGETISVSLDIFNFFGLTTKQYH